MNHLNVPLLYRKMILLLLFMETSGLMRFR